MDSPSNVPGSRGMIGTQWIPAATISASYIRASPPANDTFHPPPSVRSARSTRLAEADVVVEPEPPRVRAQVRECLGVIGIVGILPRHREVGELGQRLGGDQVGGVVDRAVGQGDVPDAADVALALEDLEGDRGRLEMAGGREARGAGADDADCPVEVKLAHPGPTHQFIPMHSPTTFTLEVPHGHPAPRSHLLPLRQAGGGGAARRSWPTWRCSAPNGSRPDAIGVVDVKPGSKSYGRVVGQFDMPNTRRRAAPLRLERLQRQPLPLGAAPARRAALPRGPRHQLVADPHPRHQGRTRAGPSW